jgi:MoaA/NifB/PqqE/SkfB family radical SAM enzyme
MIARFKSAFSARPDSKTAAATAARGKRPWKLWQVEPTLACNLGCIMCPWVSHRAGAGSYTEMQERVWDRLVPYLDQVESVDFTGGGEPLLHPRLFDWARTAKKAGCRTGFLSNGLLLSPARAAECLAVDLDWIGFSIDAADPEIFTAIRGGADFKRVCSNIEHMAAARPDVKPRILVNFVMMRQNAHQFEDIIRLAGRLGVDQVNFKNCDVSRGSHGQGLGLMEGTRSKRVKNTARNLKKALRLAEKLRLHTTSFSLVPDEQPVCLQDPRTSLFISYDGRVAPCINLAMGGESRFLDDDIVFPTQDFGSLLERSLKEIWQDTSYREFRASFALRSAQYHQQLATTDFGHDLIKMKEAFRAAVTAMDSAPRGCRRCHYLYDI